MTELETYINSGILERYVLGDISPGELEELRGMVENYPSLSGEIDAIRDSLETYAFAHSVDPPSEIKTQLMSNLDHIPQDRKKKQMDGHPATEQMELPELNETSALAFWRKTVGETSPPEDAGELYARLLGKNDKMRTYVVWSKTGVPEEIHTNLLERFFVLEGTCDCVIGGKTTKMKPGDFMEIPLHTLHHITVTSGFPMKVILQKMAA